MLSISNNYEIRGCYWIVSHTILERIIYNSIKLPENIAVVDDEGTVTYENLIRAVKSVSIKLMLNGVSANDKIMLEAVSNSKFVVTYFAIQSIGAICVPYPLNSKTQWVHKILNEVNAALIIMENKNISIQLKHIMYSDLSFDADNFDTENSDYNLDIPNENYISDILYTSGTTGTDKGVILTHRSTYYAADNIAQALEISASDMVLLPLPLHHSNGLGTMRTYLKEGAGIILMNGVMKLNTLKRMIMKYPCSAFSCSPVMLEVLNMLTNGGYVELFEDLRYIEIGTAPASNKLREIIKKKFPHKKLFINYGATESPRAIYMDINNVDDTKRDSIGKTIGDYKAAIIDDNCNIIDECNKVGRLALKGKALMSGYWNNEKLTAEVSCGSYFLTGDIAYIDSDDYVYLQGRTTDMIIIGGEKVYPIEIENVISEVSFIRESAVIGVEDMKHFTGQQPIAFVVLNKNTVFSPQIIIKHLESKLTSFKIPYKIIPIDELPRNLMGKIDRNSLKKLWQDNSL